MYDVYLGNVNAEAQNLSTFKNKRKPIDEMHRDLLIGKIQEGLTQTNLLVISSEPGMGKSTVLNQYARLAATKDIQGYYLDFHSLEYGAVLESLVLIADRLEGLMSENGDAPLLIISGFPYFISDPNSQIQEIIQNIIAGGTKILMSMHPESEYLFETIDEASYLRCENLLVYKDEFDEWFQGTTEKSYKEMYELTHGIPCLTAAFTPLSLSEGLEHIKRNCMAGYSLELISHVRELLRLDLTFEERNLRCVLFMLGEGSFKDLEYVLGQVDLSLLAKIQRDAAYFGLDLCMRSFSCGNNSSFKCFSLLKDILAQGWLSQDIIWRCIYICAQKGLFNRACALATAVKDISLLQKTAFMWPFELVNMGQLKFVRQALEQTSLWGLQDISYRDGYELAWLINSYFTEDIIQSKQDLEDYIAAHPSAEKEILRLKVIHNSFLTLATFDDASYYDIDLTSEKDDFIEAIACHTYCFKKICSGYPKDAYTKLLLSGRLSQGDSLVAHILLIDLALAKCLIGDEIDADFQARVNYACEQFTLYCDDFIRDAVELIPNFVRDLYETDEEFLIKAERATSQASRKAQWALQSLLIFITAVLDLSKSCHVRAYTRFDLGLSCSAKAKLFYIHDLSQMFSDFISHMLGKTIVLRSPDRQVEDPYTLGIYALMTIITEDTAGQIKIQRRLKDCVCPLGLLWVVALLRKLIPDAMQQAQRAFPKSWLVLFDQVETGDRGYIATGDEIVCGDGVDDYPQLKLFLLGTQEAYLGNRKIEDRQWARKASRELLFILAATENHVVSRADLLEMIWPDSDYMTGRNNLYTALSVLRSTVGQRFGEPPYILGGQGYISLNPKLVYCDIDEICTLAQSVLLKPSADATIVQVCEHLKSLYKGDIMLPSSIDVGFFTRIKQEVECVYADAMIEGAEAAFRLGMPKKAVWFARAALQKDSLREDGVIILLASLVSTGRIVECQDVYRQYVDELFEATGSAPSTKFQEIYTNTIKSSFRNTLPLQ